MAYTPKNSGYLRGLLSLVFIVSLLVLFGFLIALGYNFSSSGVMGSQPQFDINASSIALIGTPGKAAAFNLTGSSINSLWASDTGLSLELHNNSGFHETYGIVGYTAENWGDNITCYSTSDCTQDFYINAIFTLPSYLAESADRTLSGSLTGDLTTPQDTPNGQFENSQMQLDIPVSLKLGIIHTGLHRAREISLFGTLISLGTCVALLVSVGKVQRRRLLRGLGVFVLWIFTRGQYPARRR